MIPTRKIGGPDWYADFLIPSDDRIGHHSEICARNVLNGSEYGYPRTIAEPVKTLVDIGVNLGQFTAWASRHWPSLERAWGYEPHAEAFDIAAKNLRGLTTIGVSLIPAAVTTNPTPRLMPEPGLAENWGGWRTHNATSGERVAAVHPRDLPPCDVLKIDCEGSEGEVVLNYPHLEAVRVLAIEIHDLPTEVRHAMYKRIDEAGFVLKRGQVGDPSWDLRVWVRP